ncbi:MAG TPA: metal-dependent hydrolase [Thermoanaerobaculia bacterium]|jgi:inner membrane protein|nr:metal-dependent hydrolase [Thermoanaerobaculia bacterium]
MDTVSHGIAGSVLSRTLTDRHTARAALVLGLVGAMLPDADMFFLNTRMEYLRGHRGWSHTLLLLPLFALALAVLIRLVYRYARHARLSTLFVFAAVGIATHIAFDWITSFGIMFLIPFSRHRFALDWVFILDPYFTGIASVSLLATTIFRPKGRLLSSVGALVLVAYVALCAIMHSRALEIWKRMDAPPAGTKVAVLPQFLSPFRWLGLSDRGNEIHASFFDIGPFAKGNPSPRPPERLSDILRSLRDSYPPPDRARIQRYEKPSPSAELLQAENLPDVRIYLDFARFPLATVQPEPDGTTSISFQDLRFLPWFTGPWERERGRGMRFRRQPFVYRVRLDRAGRPLDGGFVGSTAN